MSASLAILRAYVLAGELSKVNDSEHSSNAFEACESTFRPFVEETQKIPFFVPAIGHPETVWKRRLVGPVLCAGPLKVRGNAIAGEQI